MTMIIVKVQRPIASSEDISTVPWLFYSKGRVNKIFQKPNAVVRELMGDDLKGYFQGWFSHGIWVVGHRVRDRDW